jgi:hypothetical protein
MNPGIVTVRRTFGQHLHYTGVMNPGIVTIRRKFRKRCANTHTSWDRWGICRELPPHKQGIPSEEGGSAVNYQLIDKESTRGRGFHRELPAYLLGFRPVRSKLAKNPSNSNDSRISSSKFYILTIPTCLTI